ncbi:MAG TPA: biotin-dependent carboxyltransferase family protein, partial [Micromonosporaceae bacterium]|nr:biotin-dependent carboxyltransferase family protein [Micromonosporaceae bacterium]
LGRPGWAHLGVPRSGALDVPALLRANQLVGNPAGHAALETTLTGCALRLGRPGTIAVTGAQARVRVAGQTVDLGRPVAVSSGAVVEIGPARRGVRSYLAINGGIEIEPVLGSRSTDTLSGLGHAPLRDGDRVPLGPTTPLTPMGSPEWEPPPAALELPVRLGPRDDWFTAEAIEALLSTPYTVSTMSNRVGVRLTGAALPRAKAGELPSEGIVLGAVQVPADGQPLVFLADHPTTGGYPVIAVVQDVTPLAQARPGTTVRFHGSQR